MPIMTTNEWLRQAPHISPGGLGGLRRRALCESGLAISIQASGWHYCSPKEDDASHYTFVEVGFPERDGKRCRLRTLRRYCAGADVYGYVNVEALDRIIRRNGGIIGAGDHYEEV